MAEELDWDIEAFDEAFREVFQQGMLTTFQVRGHATHQNTPGG